MLKINHLNISYQNTPAVKDLSLAVGDGQIVGIAGESGSGRSTMLSSIIGLLGREGRITAGDILFEGRQLRRMKDRELEKIRGKDIAMIFQQPESSFDPVTTIGKQFCEAVRVHEKVSKKEALDRGRELLEKLHFQDPERILDSYAFELSGGMCQRRCHCTWNGMQSQAFAGGRAYECTGCNGTVSDSRCSDGTPGKLWYIHPDGNT